MSIKSLLFAGEQFMHTGNILATDILNFRTLGSPLYMYKIKES